MTYSAKIKELWSECRVWVLMVSCCKRSIEEEKDRALWFRLRLPSSGCGFKSQA